MRAAWPLGALAAVLASTSAAAAPSVWAIDDGEKIKRDATSLPFETGKDNPVWSPGQPLRLFALKNETVAFQIVVEADASPLAGVTVDLDGLHGPGGATLADAPGATDPASFVGRPIERFVEHYFTVARASGGKTAGESLGWNAGAAPPAGRWTGAMPDALIPVELAPPWDPYPLAVAADTNGVVWIDVTVPADQAPGLYGGSVVVKAAGEPLATLPVELEIGDAVLPDRITKTMVYYARSELDRRIGGGDAVEAQYFRLLHRHRLAPMHAATTALDVTRQLAALDGSAFVAAKGYDGPGIGEGDGVLALGPYGSLGAPSPAGLSLLEQIADTLASNGVLESTDVFVYAADEDCASPYGKGWKELLATSTDAHVKHVRVAWTCSDDPVGQPVDVVMQLDSFDAARTAAARAAGKEVWVYNGVRPMDGAFLTDTEATSPRVNGWLGGTMDIGRWFYWESTFWYDDNRGGQGAYDPFVTAETFHNLGGDFCQGDGVLVYPGKQVDLFAAHSLGFDGVIPSIRLKSWRRGIEDAGYYQLARAKDPAAADAIARDLLRAAMSGATKGGMPAWPDSGRPFFEARRALYGLVPRGSAARVASPVGPASPGPSLGDAASARPGCGCRRGCARDPGGTGMATGATTATIGLVWISRTSRRRRRGARGRAPADPAGRT